MTTDSLKKRYLAKLFANLIGLVIGVVTQAIIPRGLGPKAYGDFSFLSDFFSQLMPIFSLNTSMAFYTKLSQRRNEFALISFYSQFTAMAFISLFIFVYGTQMTGLSKVFWPDQRMSYVYMACVWMGLVWITQLLIRVADAYGLTVSTEIARICQKCLGLLVVSTLFFMGQLSLTTFFFYHYAILLFLIILLVAIIYRKGPSLHTWRLQKAQITGYIKELYTYSNPLFVYGLFGAIVGIFDRWLLQEYAGSVQQGFFGLSFRICVVCFLFTNAMTSLFTREMAIAYGNGDRRQMARLFRRYVPLLYSIAAFFGCFLSLQAEKVSYIFGGNQFAGATTAMMIMALYPIHLTYGQLNGSVFYASGQTKLYRNIGMIQYLLGLPITYFLLAPVENFGLNAGATGLALKFVLVNVIIVNVQIFFNTRFMGLRFMRYIVHQIMSVACLLGVAAISILVIDKGLGLHDKVVLSFFLSGVLYTLMVAILGYAKPVLFGLQRRDIHSLIQLCIQKINRV